MGNKKKILLITFCTLSYRILGFLREIFIAKKFGASEVTDAYFMANSIPNVIIEIFAVGALSSAIIPLLISKIDKKESFKKSGEIFLGNFLAISMIILILLLILNKIIITNIAPGFSFYKKEITFSFSKILFFTVPLLIINELLNSLLNCFQFAGFISWSHFIYNFFVLLIGFIFSKYYGINAFVYGILFSSIFRLLLIYLKLGKILGFLKIKINFKDSRFLMVLKLLYPIMLASISVQINFVVDRLLGSKLEEGSITYLTYSNKLIQLPLGIILGSVVLTLFPVLVSYIENKDKKKYQTFIATKIDLIILIMGFISIITCVFSDWIISIVFQRGEFSEREVFETAKILRYYAFSIILISYITFFQKIFYSLKETKIPAIINIFVVIINIFLSIILSKKMGLSGIALGTIIAKLFNVFLLFYTLRRKIVFKIDYKNYFKIVFFNIMLFLIAYKTKECTLIFYNEILFHKIKLFFLNVILLTIFYLFFIYLFFPYKKFFNKKGEQL